MYREHLKSVLTKLLQKTLTSYSTLTGSRVGDNTRDGQTLDALNQGLRGVMEAAVKATPPAQPVPAPVPASVGQCGFPQNWLDPVIEEFWGFNANGSDYVGSCSEALLKSHGALNALFGANRLTTPQRRVVYFRGETDYGWTLVPRISRTTSIAPVDPLRTTIEELDHLSDFRKRVINDKELAHNIFGDSLPPDLNDPSWWTTMQHYDDRIGTRMLDVTTSIFSALYFSCADWTGGINSDVDGSLYLFFSGAWRGESKVADPYSDAWCATSDSYFNVAHSPDVARFRCGRSRNDRLVAQDGFFFWQPNFKEPLNTGQCFKFRVFRGAKKRILSELYSIGYTARRIVRGELGEQAHRTLCSTLNLDPSC